MWIKVRLVDSVLWGSFASPGITDDARTQQVVLDLLGLIVTAGETKKLLLSFEGVRWMPSAVIGKLVLLTKMAKTHGVQLAVCDVSPNVLEVFKITRLNKVFKIFTRKDLDDLDDDNEDDPGSGAVFAKLPKRPSSGGAHAKPSRDDQ